MNSSQSNNLTTRRILFASAIGLVCITGCVQRRLIVKTQPEGAFVSIDNIPVGYSPLSVPHTYYGTREFKVEKDGYKTVNVQERIRPKWYSTFPISFITENFWPVEIRDQRVFDFQLQPKTMTDENGLVGRANDLRLNVERGTVAAPVR